MSARQTEHRQTETRRVNFVAPEREQTAIQLPAAVPMKTTPADVVTPGRDASRDSVSAEDRAKAMRRRASPIWWLVVAGSFAATFAYTLAANAAGFSAAFNLDKFLVFAAVLTISGMGAYLRLNRLDFDHSRAGVERYRMKSYTEIRKEEIRAEVELRTAALDAQLRMLEMQNTGSEPHRRPQLSDRGQR